MRYLGELILRLTNVVQHDADSLGQHPLLVGVTRIVDEEKLMDLEPRGRCLEWKP